MHTRVVGRLVGWLVGSLQNLLGFIWRQSISAFFPGPRVFSTSWLLLATSLEAWYLSLVFKLAARHHVPYSEPFAILRKLGTPDTPGTRDTTLAKSFFSDCSNVISNLEGLFGGEFESLQVFGVCIQSRPCQIQTLQHRNQAPSQVKQQLLAIAVDLTSMCFRPSRPCM